MLNITIELEDNEEIDGYSMGHMIFEGEKNIVSSKNRMPVQSMMVFLSIVLLLDGVRFFCTSKKLRYEFVGIDSSFIIDFKKCNSNGVSLSQNKIEITTVEVPELIGVVYNSVKKFLDRYLSCLSPDDIAYEDIISSFKEFEEFKNSI